MKIRLVLLAALVFWAGVVCSSAQTASLVANATALAPGGGQVTLTFNATFSGNPAVFSLDVSPPAGWTYVSGTGEPLIKPSAGNGAPLSWTDVSRLPSPVQFGFVLAYPAGTTAATITSAVTLRQNVTVTVVDKTTGATTNETREVRTDLLPTLVTFGLAPVITTAPTSQTATAGTTATLNVVATGTAPLTYVWRKDGSALSGATSASLALANVQVAQAGSYSVVVSNPFGTVTSGTAVLTVSNPSSGGGGGGGGGGGFGGGGLTPLAPSITAQPANVSVAVGAATSFSVTAEGTAPLAYQWRKNTVAISGATNSTLTFTAVTAADAASYSVVVTNSAGSVASNAATLTLLAPPAITTQPASLAVAEGEPASFSVVATGALSYQWRKNSVAIAGATAATLALTRVSAADAASYSVVVTNAAGSTTSGTATLTLRATGYTGSYFGAFGDGGSFALYVRSNQTAVFLGYASASRTTFIARDVTVDSSGRLRFTVNAAPATSPGTAAAAPDLTIDGVISSTGSLSGTVSGVTTLSGARAASAGSAQSISGYYEAGAANSSATSYAIVSPGGQAFVLHVSPAATDVGSGTVDSSGRFAVTTAANSTVTGLLTAATSTLTASVTTAAGAKTDFAGGSDTRSATEKLLNIATRGLVGSQSGEMIAGFVIRGDAPKSVLIRAVGPTLGTFGVTTALTSPRLELVSAAGASLAVNTGWANSAALAAAASRVGAFALAPNSQDAALLVSLAPGAYTAVVSGVGGTAGVALIEVYDASENSSSAQKVVNIASRGTAGGGDATLTAGFVISGTVPKRVLIRGIGPTLGGFGVLGTLADPQLKLYDQPGTVIAANEDWGTPAAANAATAAQISSAAASVGAFALAPGSKDAALLLNLAPGAYTVQVGGVTNLIGTALVEVYEVP